MPAATLRKGHCKDSPHSKHLALKRGAPKLLPAHSPCTWRRSAQNISYLLVLPDGSEAGGFHVVAPATQPVIAFCRKNRKVHDWVPCHPQRPVNPL